MTTSSITAQTAIIRPIELEFASSFSSSTQEKTTEFIPSLGKLSPQDIFLALLFSQKIIDPNGCVEKTSLTLSPLPDLNTQARQRLGKLYLEQFPLKIQLDKKTKDAIVDDLKFKFKKGFFKGGEKQFNQFLESFLEIPEDFCLQSSFNLEDLIAHVRANLPKNIQEKIEFTLHGGFLKSILKDWIKEILPKFGIENQKLINHLTEYFKDPVSDMDFRIFIPEIGQNKLWELDAEIIKFLAKSFNPLDEHLQFYREIVKITICKVDENKKKFANPENKDIAVNIAINGEQPLDILCFEQLKRQHLFILDALFVSIFSQTLHCNYFQEWQPVVDRLGKLINIDNIDEVDPKIIVRFCSLIANGHRCLKEGVSSSLYKKITAAYSKTLSSTITYFLSDFHKKHHTQNAIKLISMTMNIFAILQNESVDPEVIKDIWKKIQTEFPEDIKGKNLYTLIADALNNNEIFFNEIWALLGLLGFLNTQVSDQPKLQTFVTNHEGKLHIQIVDDCAILLPYDPIKALKILLNIKPKFWEALSPLINYMLPEGMTICSDPSQVIQHLEKLHIPLTELKKLSFLLVDKPKDQPKKIGYQLMLFCQALQPEISLSTALLDLFPKMVGLDNDLLTRQNLLKRTKALFTNTPHLSPLFAHMEQAIQKNPTKQTLLLEYYKGLFSIKALKSKEFFTVEFNKMLSLIDLSQKRKFGEELMKMLQPDQHEAASSLLLALQKTPQLFQGDQEIAIFIETLKRFPENIIVFTDNAEQILINLKKSDRKPSNLKDLMPFIHKLYCENNWQDCSILNKFSELRIATPKELTPVWITVSRRYLETDPKNAFAIWKEAAKNHIPLDHPLSLAGIELLSEIYELYVKLEIPFCVVLEFLCKSNICQDEKELMRQRIHELLENNLDRALFLCLAFFHHSELQQNDMDELRNVLTHCKTYKDLKQSTLNLLIKICFQWASRNHTLSQQKRKTKTPVPLEEISWLIQEAQKRLPHEATNLLSEVYKNKLLSPQAAIKQSLAICQSILDTQGGSEAANVWKRLNNQGIWNLSILTNEQQSMLAAICSTLLKTGADEKLFAELLIEAAKAYHLEPLHHLIKQLVIEYIQNTPSQYLEISSHLKQILSEDQRNSLQLKAAEYELKNGNINKLVTHLLILIKTPKVDVLNLVNELFNNFPVNKADQQHIIQFIAHHDFHLLVLKNTHEVVEIFFSFIEKFITKEENSTERKIVISLIKILLTHISSITSKTDIFRLAHTLITLFGNSAFPSKDFPGVPDELKASLPILISNLNQHQLFEEVLLLLEPMGIRDSIFLSSKGFQGEILSKFLKELFQAASKMIHHRPELIHTVLLHLKCHEQRPPIIQTYSTFFQDFVTYSFQNSHLIPQGIFWLEHLLKYHSKITGKTLTDWGMLLSNQTALLPRIEGIITVLANRHECMANFTTLTLKVIDKYLLINNLEKCVMLLTTYQKILKTSQDSLCLTKKTVEALLEKKDSQNGYTAWQLIKIYQIIEQAYLENVLDLLTASTNIHHHGEAIEVFRVMDMHTFFNGRPLEYSKAIEKLANSKSETISSYFLNFLNNVPSNPFFFDEKHSLYHEIVMGTVLKKLIGSKGLNNKILTAVEICKRHFTKDSDIVIIQQLATISVYICLEKKDLASYQQACKDLLEVSKKIPPEKLLLILLISFQNVLKEGFFHYNEKGIKRKETDQKPIASSDDNNKFYIKELGATLRSYLRSPLLHQEFINRLLQIVNSITEENPNLDPFENIHGNQFNNEIVEFLLLYLENNQKAIRSGQTQSLNQDEIEGLLVNHVLIGAKAIFFRVEQKEIIANWKSRLLLLQDILSVEINLHLTTIIDHFILHDDHIEEKIPIETFLNFSEQAISNEILKISIRELIITSYVDSLIDYAVETDNVEMSLDKLRSISTQIIFCGRSFEITQMMVTKFFGIEANSFEDFKLLFDFCADKIQYLIENHWNRHSEILNLIDEFLTDYFLSNYYTNKKEFYEYLRQVGINLLQVAIKHPEFQLLENHPALCFVFQAFLQYDLSCRLINNPEIVNRITNLLIKLFNIHGSYTKTLAIDILLTFLPSLKVIDLTPYCNRLLDYYQKNPIFPDLQFAQDKIQNIEDFYNVCPELAHFKKALSNHSNPTLHSLFHHLLAFFLLNTQIRLRSQGTNSYTFTILLDEAIKIFISLKGSARFINCPNKFYHEALNYIGQFCRYLILKALNPKESFRPSKWNRLKQLEQLYRFDDDLSSEQQQQHLKNLRTTLLNISSELKISNPAFFTEIISDLVSSPHLYDKFPQEKAALKRLLISKT